MNINKLPRKAFYEAPARESWSSEVECSSLILLPQCVSLILLPQGVSLHDSGYRFMDAVAEKDDTLICRVAGGSDVFDLCAPSVIWTKDRTPTHHSGWSIDCLARSGLFRIFVRGYTIKVGASLSCLNLHPMETQP